MSDEKITPLAGKFHDRWKFAALVTGLNQVAGAAWPDMSRIKGAARPRPDHNVQR